MKLHGTPPSHFTRKVRVLLQELGLPFEFSLIKSLLETGEENFGQNPLLQLPILEDQGRNIIDSDIICEYLLERYGAGQNALALYPEGDIWEHKKRLAIMNGGMGAGVKLIRAQRSNLTWACPFFRQEQYALDAALRWLDQDLGAKDWYGQEGSLSLLDITLVCFADWAVFREMVPSLEKYPNVKRFAAFHASRPAFAETHPASPLPVERKG